MQRIALIAVTLAVACAPGTRRPGSGGTPAEGAARTPTDTAAVATVAERWWRAMTLGDTGYLAPHTAARLRVTLSNGKALGQRELLADAATHLPKPSTFVHGMTDVSVLRAGDAVVVNGRMEEGSQGGSNTFHYLTVLERAGAVWQVVAAQSTREISLTSRVPAQVAGPLSDYVGSYRGQRGGIVRVVARDSVLALVSPDGTDARLEPIGPSLFELPTLYDGIAVVRFLFSRGSDGRVATLSRLIHGSVVSWTRIP